MRTQRRRTGSWQRRLMFESLETRRVLNAQLGLLGGTDLPALASSEPTGEAAGLSVAANPAFLRFASADELKQYLIKDAVVRYADMFGKDTWYWPYPYMNARYGSEFDAMATVSGALDAKDHSQTNNQVAGVEEADLVQTDGDYLYVLADQQLSIVDLQSSSGMCVVSTTATVGQPVAMYLDGEHVTVISSGSPYSIMPMMAVADFAPWNPTQYQPTFHVTVLDVTDHAHPQVARDLKLDGTYVDSREINGFVYIVSQDNFVLPPPETHPVPGSSGTPTDSAALEASGMARLMPIWIDPAGQRYVYETQDEYLTRIKDQELDLALPHFAASGGDGQQPDAGLLTQPEKIYQPLTGQASNLLSITTIGVTSPTPVIVASTSAPLDWASEVYVSPNNLYLAMPKWDGATGGESTTLYKFGLDTSQGLVTLVAAGAVPGHLLNQFSLDEYNGDLRVVTQQGWRANAESGLYILRQSDLALSTIGSLEHLATGENLFSVRFLGDLGYLVTFGPTGGGWYDPLFTMNLSDPTKPELGGQLDMPGFSNYLQSLEGHYLLGLGQNADPDNGRPLEPQVSLYDVADLAQPQLAGQLSFASQGNAWSEAFSDHHAIAYYPEYHVLAIPMNNFGPVVVTTGAGTDPMPVYREQSALWVFHIDVNADTTNQGKIQLLGTIEDDSTVRRSVRVGRVLYSISQDTIKARDIEHPDVVLGEVHLPKGTIVDPNPGGTVDPPAAATGPIWATGVSESDLSADARRMVALAAADLAKRLSVSIETITVAQVEAVSWPDSGLGIHQDGQLVLQVIVDGFRIVLDHETTRYAYHTDSANNVLLAETTPVNALVRVRLEVVDAAGQPLTSVEAGQPFVLNVYVQDLRAEAQGVSAAYLDLLYPEALIDVAGELKFGNEYQTQTSGVATATGLLDELGAAHGATRFDDSEHLLTSVPFQAQWPGLVSFVTVSAHQTDHTVMLSGAAGSVSSEQVAYGDVQLVVTAGWQNANNPGDVDGDGVTKPLDVLKLITHLNNDGPRHLGPVREFLQQTATVTHEFLDVNGDGDLTPRDVLTMINRINQLLTSGQDSSTDTSQGWGWARDLSGPLGGFVDWGNLTSALRSQDGMTALAGLKLTPDQALAWVHDVVAAVDVTSLVAPTPGAATPVDARAMVDKFGQILLKQGDNPSTVRLQSLVSSADKLVDDLDLDALLPGLAAHLDLATARAAVRDRLFAKLSDPASLLSLWNG
ncbi:MAG: beta-propeller domain-containing protein [Planctomycetota bacterium]|nr:beta-propeller domain-containing protein [Planctomycetota bacterium]